MKTTKKSVGKNKRAITLCSCKPISKYKLHRFYGFKRRIARNKRGQPRLRKGKRFYELWLPQSIKERLKKEFEMKMCGYVPTR